MKDLKRFKKLALKLFVPLHFDIFAIQLDLLTRIIAMTLHSFVMGSLLQFLCMKFVLATNFHQFSQLFS